jgi:ABC-type dipeptide/oligopeptide/nickel transport system ATPase subunit
MRTFEDKPAKRAAVPLLIGLTGPSGSGKTYSALRLATGMQRVTGGEIFGIDTEANRMLHYASAFKFRHVAFGAPFGALDYLAAIEHCVNKGARVIVIDSMSHEHEGPGGLLEQHADEVHRMAGDDWKKAERVKMLAWQKPKQARRRLLNSIIQLPCNFVFCFRAKEKLKMARGQEPLPLGWMAIAGEEFVYEMTVNALMLPGAQGVPTWQSDQPGERETIKLPAQFAKLREQPGPLDEKTGERFARWAAGDVAPAPATQPEPQDDEPPIGALKTDRSE